MFLFFVLSSERVKLSTAKTVYDRNLLYVAGSKKIVSRRQKVGQDNVNIGVVTIFRLANTRLLQVY